MDFYTYLAALKQSWLWLVALTLVGIILGGGIATVQTKQYRSEASLFVAAERAGNAAELAQGSAFVQNLVTSYTSLAQSALVLTPVIDELGLDTSAAALASKIEATTPRGTVIVTVAATDSDPKVAQQIAQATTNSLRETVGALAPEDASGATAITLTEIAPAEVPTSPATPNLNLYILVGFGAGAFAGIVAAMVRWANQSGSRDSRPTQQTSP